MPVLVQTGNSVKTALDHRDSQIIQGLIFINHWGRTPYSTIMNSIISVLYLRASSIQIRIITNWPEFRLKKSPGRANYTWITPGLIRGIYMILLTLNFIHMNHSAVPPV